MSYKPLLFIALLILMVSSLFRCKPEEVPENSPPTSVDTLTLAEKIAGRYSGEYSCGTYNGQSYGSYNGADTLELVAVGRDTLHIVHYIGCIADYYAYIQDTIINPGAPYSTWLAYNSLSNLPYEFHRLTYNAATDSLFISQPEHTGFGWLTRAFLGKRI